MIFVEHVQLEPSRTIAGYSSCASDLGLRPGNWPPHLSATDAAGMPFMLHRKQMLTNAGEFCGYVYEGASYKLSVFND